MPGTEQEIRPNSDPNQEEPQHWWSELQRDIPIPVLIYVKLESIELPHDESLDHRMTRKTLGNIEGKAAVQAVKQYIDENVVLFPDGTSDRIFNGYFVGILSGLFTPSQCDALLESGLIESITKNPLVSLMSE